MNASDFVTAEEFENSLASTGHTLAEVEARDRGTRLEDITAIRLKLSNGEAFTIEPRADIDGFLTLVIDHVDS